MLAPLVVLVVELPRPVALVRFCSTLVFRAPVAYVSVPVFAWFLVFPLFLVFACKRRLCARCDTM
jgi:hypothetical protein